MLAGKLNMEPEAAEKWIVNLIRSARLFAKLDSQVQPLPCHESLQRSQAGWFCWERVPEWDGSTNVLSLIAMSVL